MPAVAPFRTLDEKMRYTGSCQYTGIKTIGHGVRGLKRREREASRMRAAPTLRRIATGTVVWYLGARLTDTERLAYAQATSGVVLRGETGAKAAARMRAAGYGGRLWLDPAAYEEKDQPQRETLFGDYWQVRQDELGVAESVSPGSYVAKGDVESLKRALDSEGAWVSEAGGRLSLALEAGWLADDLEALIEEFQAVGLPLALAFSDPNDPLGLRGAVNGLVYLLNSVGDIAVLRCDLGGIGSAVHGASVGTVGTSTVVRHAVPPGQKAGGAPRDTTPSVFVPKLLDFKLGSLLDSFPREASPTCELECCEGSVLRRFNGEHMNAEARRHNRLAIGEIIHKVLSAEDSQRAGIFKAMCVDAEHEAHVLSMSARRRLRVRPQVAAWARL